MAFCCYRKYLDKESKEWNHIIRRKSGVFRKTARVGRPFAREWSSSTVGHRKPDLWEMSRVIASAEQKMALQRLLNEGHLAWDKRRGVCSESLYAPKDGQLVKLSILDEHVILGAFKEIDAKGRVVLYCLLDEDGSLRYSLHETVGYAVNLQILPIGTSGRSRLSDALRQKGLAWNGRLKELERLATRVRRGDKYYYLNDILEIRECRDNNRPADRKRLECGNYFMERRDAELVRDCVRSVVRLNRDKDARR